MVQEVQMVDTEAAADGNSNMKISIHEGGPEEALLQETPFEAEPNVLLSGRQCLISQRLTYKKGPYK